MSESPNHLRGDSNSTTSLGKVGFEIELLAPRGGSRLDLANAIALQCEGTVQRFFHPQGELSKAAKTPFFENLTLAFRVLDGDGNRVADCVDDFTLQNDLDERAPPKRGWYRIVSDDARLLRLLKRHADAEDPLESVLEPAARLFGTEVAQGAGGMRRVSDETGASIAIGALLPGERERPCELVTAPIEADHEERLREMLDLARELGFTVPSEGATHLHFDAKPLCSAHAVGNLVRFFEHHGLAIKESFDTNDKCRRLGSWPESLGALVRTREFLALDWEAAQAALRQIPLTKYCDFNIRNLVQGTPDKHTFEVRILPVSLDADEVIRDAEKIARILSWACDPEKEWKEVPEQWEQL